MNADNVVAGAPILAGVGGAFVRVCHACGSLEAAGAVATELADKVATGAPVFTRRRGTLVDVVLTMCSIIT